MAWESRFLVSSGGVMVSLLDKSGGNSTMRIGAGAGEIVMDGWMKSCPL